jgi:hypothetical protein
MIRKVSLLAELREKGKELVPSAQEGVQIIALKDLVQDKPTSPDESDIFRTFWFGVSRVVAAS